ncbi:hypothetical protein [Actinophytocola sp.]|uniref:hypothetical protein n=1 Tax=Actinophytocola sp. TaxID=1872138 RepID=UPI0039C8A7DC
MTRLEEDLRARGAAYSTDASNYRQVPIGVVLPTTVDDAERAIAVCRKHDVPALSRGGHLRWPAIAQPHCHRHAVLGFDADRELLRHHGVDLQVLDAGRCGLAGNVGFERGHYEVSMACAEHALLPLSAPPVRTRSCSPTASAAAPGSSTPPPPNPCTRRKSWPQRFLGARRIPVHGRRITAWVSPPAASALPKMVPAVLIPEA